MFQFIKNIFMEPNQTPHEVAPIVPSASLPPKKMGKLRASYLLAIEGLELLKKDKQVVLFPIFSALASIVLLVIFCVLYWLLGGDINTVNTVGADGVKDTTFSLDPAGYAALLVLYLALAFVATFFQAGLTAIVDARINGKSMTFQEGVNRANAHLEKIFLWALVSATVGVILGLISEKSKWLGKIISFFLGATWGIVTFFIVPTLILEEGNVSDAIKSSAGTFKKTWGEAIVVNFGAGLFFGIAALLGIIIFGVIMALCFVFLPVVVAIPIFFLFLTILIMILVGICVLSSAINSVFRVVLYAYAKSGYIADTFAPELILGALKKKGE
jgi:hypothetical protein